MKKEKENMKQNREQNKENFDRKGKVHFVHFF